MYDISGMPQDIFHWREKTVTTHIYAPVNNDIKNEAVFTYYRQIL